MGHAAPTKITLGEMRQSGPRRVLVYCGDYKCSHSVVIVAGRWGNNGRLSDLEPQFTCKLCGHRGADLCVVSSIRFPVNKCA